MEFMEYSDDRNAPAVEVGVFVDVVEITGKKFLNIQAGFVDWCKVSKWRHAVVKPVAMQRLPIERVDIDAIHRKRRPMQRTRLAAVDICC